MQDTDRTPWDAIVIGSGKGAMAAAVALSNVGHKVLLLKQFQTLGGLTHSFSREGISRGSFRCFFERKRNDPLRNDRGRKSIVSLQLAQLLDGP